MDHREQLADLLDATEALCNELEPHWKDRPVRDLVNALRAVQLSEERPSLLPTNRQLAECANELALAGITPWMSPLEEKRAEEEFAKRVAAVRSVDSLRPPETWRFCPVCGKELWWITGVEQGRQFVDLAHQDGTKLCAGARLEPEPPVMDDAVRRGADSLAAPEETKK